jgi:hypothetical protein
MEHDVKEITHETNAIMMIVVKRSEVVVLNKGKRDNQSMLLSIEFLQK